jgi:hypothetical protein
MAEIILSETDSESEELKEYGEFQLVCIKYETTEVVLEVRDPDTNIANFPWVTARYNGNDIKFENVGDAIDVVLTRGFTYRLTTTTIGAVISIARHAS